MGASRTQTATTDVINAGDPTVLQNILDGGGTVAAWFYVNSTGQTSNTRFFTKQGGANFSLTAGWALLITAGSVYLRVRYTSNSKNWVGPTMPTDSWIHLCCTFDCSSFSNTAIMYFNGVSQTVTPGSNPTGSYVSDVGNDFFIGSGTATDNRGLVGKIAYAQAFDRILSNDEVYEIMYKPGSIRTNLVGYWPLIEDVRDLSGNGNNVTLTGGSYSVDGPPVTSFK